MIYEIRLTDETGREFQIIRFTAGSGVTFEIEPWRRVARVTVLPVPVPSEILIPRHPSQPASLPSS